MGNSINNFKIEEFKTLREEIADRDRGMTHLFGAAVATSLAILSAVGTIFFGRKPDELKHLNEAYAYPFLAPLLVVIPILFVLVSHRRDIHRAGTYISVFFEETSYGPLWGTRLAKFRRLAQGESLDFLPISLWAIALISICGFVYALYSISGFSDCRVWSIAAITVIISIVFMIIGHIKFHYASRHAGRDFKLIWENIRNEEREIQE